MKRVLLTVVIAVAAATVGASVGKASTVNCGALSVGPGALIHGDKTGANCLLRAYQQQCRRPAIYRLSWLGVDTVALDVFRLVIRNGSCRVAVTTSFRVVPQHPHATGRGYCRALSRRGGDIVARGCMGAGLPVTISLAGHGN